MWVTSIWYTLPYMLLVGMISVGNVSVVAGAMLAMNRLPLLILSRVMSRNAMSTV